jgi:hypothetical protein
MQATIKIHNITPDRIEELQEEIILLAISGGAPTTKTSFAYDVAWTVTEFVQGVIAGFNSVQ